MATLRYDPPGEPAYRGERTGVLPPPLQAVLGGSKQISEAGHEAPAFLRVHPPLLPPPAAAPVRPIGPAVDPRVPEVASPPPPPPPGRGLGPPLHQQGLGLLVRGPGEIQGEGCPSPRVQGGPGLLTPLQRPQDTGQQEQGDHSPSLASPPPHMSGQSHAPPQATLLTTCCPSTARAHTATLSPARPERLVLGAVILGLETRLSTARRKFGGGTGGQWPGNGGVME